jgi:hypothetical protein
LGAQVAQHRGAVVAGAHSPIGAERVIGVVAAGGAETEANVPVGTRVHQARHDGDRGRDEQIVGGSQFIHHRQRLSYLLDAGHQVQVVRPLAAGVEAIEHDGGGTQRDEHLHRLAHLAGVLARGDEHAAPGSPRLVQARHRRQCPFPTPRRTGQPVVRGGVGAQQRQLEHVHAVVEAEGERTLVEPLAVGDENTRQPPPVAESQDVAKVIAQERLAAGEGNPPAARLVLQFGNQPAPPAGIHLPGGQFWPQFPHVVAVAAVLVAAGGQFQDVIGAGVGGPPAGKSDPLRRQFPLPAAERGLQPVAARHSLRLQLARDVLRKPALGQQPFP